MCSVYFHRDERIKKEKKEPTKLRRERTLSATEGKNPQRLHNLIAWLENRITWDEPEGKISAILPGKNFEIILKVAEKLDLFGKLPQ